MDEVPLREETTAVPDGSGAQMTLFTVIVTAFLFVRKFAGLARELLLARWLGANAVTDAFKNIYNSIIYNLYSDAEQLLRPTYLPEFVKQRKEDENRGWQLLGTMAGLEIVALTVVALGLVIFARPLMRALWPSLAADPVAFELAVLLLYIMAPALVLYSLSLMPELTLHALKRFTLPAFAEACYSLLQVAVLAAGVELVWHPGHPRAILAAGLGVLVGGTARLLIMLPGLWSKLSLAKLSLRVRTTPGVSEALSLMPPILLGVTVSMARPLVDSGVCSRLGPGMYTLLDYGRKQSDAFIMILPLAVSLVVFPYVSEWAVLGDRDRMARSLLWMTRAMAYIFVPLSVGIMLLARPLTDLIYHSGEFRSEDVGTVAMCFMGYAVGLFIYSIEGSINKWYFAMKDTWTPNWVGALWAVGHLTMSVVGGLYTPLGVMAVALAYPLSKGGKVLMLYFMLRPRLGRAPASEIWPFVAKVLCSSVVMGAVVWWVARHLSLLTLRPGAYGKGHLALQLVVTSAAGVVVYLAVTAMLRIEEVDKVWVWIGRKLRRALRAR